jgi:plastocyanin
MKQSQLILIGVIALVVLGGGYLLLGGKQNMGGSATSEEVQPTNAMMAETTPAEGASGAMMETSPADKMGAKTFTVSGSNFAFDVKEMKVKKGDTVTVTFKNVDGMHDWKLDEFNAATQQIQAGAEETITFVADTAGTFEYYCSVGKHRANGMVGKFIVEE